MTRVDVWSADYWEAFRPNRASVSCNVTNCWHEAQSDVATPEPPYGYRFGLAGVCVLVIMLAVRLWG